MRLANAAPGILQGTELKVLGYLCPRGRLPLDDVGIDRIKAWANLPSDLPIPKLGMFQS